MSTTGTIRWFPSGLKKILDGTIDWATGQNIRVMLLGSSVIPNISHTVIGDVSSNQISGGATDVYTAGGQLLTGLSVTVDSINPYKISLEADDVVWTPNGSKVTPISGVKYFVIYKDTDGNPAANGANDHLIGWGEFVSLAGSVASVFAIEWSPGDSKTVLPVEIQQ